MIKQIVKISLLSVIFFVIAGISAYFTLTLVIKGEGAVVVPNLIGKDVLYILEVLTDLGLNTKVKDFKYSSSVPKNCVIFQDPDAGAEIKKGRDVRIVISKGAQTVLMPNLVMLSLQQARIILEENDLSQRYLSRVYSKDIKKDEIMAQTPCPGTVVKRDKGVDLLVSMGIRPKTFKMADLKGLPLEEAVLEVERACMSPGEIKTVFRKNRQENVVVSQEPLSGFCVTERNVVNLVINRKQGKEGSVDYLHEINLIDINKAGLFKYRLKNGFIKRHIRVSLNSFGFSNDIFDNFIMPGEEILFLIPTNNDSTVFLYEDDELVKVQVF